MLTSLHESNPIGQVLSIALKYSVKYIYTTSKVVYVHVYDDVYKCAANNLGNNPPQRKKLSHLWDPNLG